MEKHDFAPDSFRTAVALVPTRARFAWALFDWANSSFATLIVTFVFAAYFARAVVGDEIRGQQLWGTAASISGLTVAVFAPVLGAIADAGGRRKPWLIVFTVAAVLGSAMLWWTEANAAFIAWAMIWYALANVCVEFGVVFANAMLPDLVPAKRIGRWSGWAWGLGYAGGVASMLVALVGFVLPEQPWFGVDKGTFEHIRIVGPLTAIWLAVFAAPLFLLTPDRARGSATIGRAVQQGLLTLLATLTKVREHANVARFLVANMLYTDGLITVFIFGGIFATGAFGMELTEVLIFGIVLNVTGGVGAALFAFVDDRVGPKRTILLSLIGLFVTALGAVTAPNSTVFWIFGSTLGLFVGPVQSAGRSMMVRLAPPGLTTEFFGLFALTGKATAFLGPALVATITAATSSQRWGLSVLLAFFAAGGLLLLTVREPRVRAS